MWKSKGITSQTISFCLSLEQVYGMGNKTESVPVTTSHYCGYQ